MSPSFWRIKPLNENFNLNINKINSRQIASTNLYAVSHHYNKRSAHHREMSLSDEWQEQINFHVFDDNRGAYIEKHLKWACVSAALTCVLDEIQFHFNTILR